MIKRLQIHNYALIDHLDISLDEGLSIITGETGAGKSIILGALSLLSGERADTKIIADKSQKTFVEAIFSAPPSSIKEVLDTHDIEWSDHEMIVRRELSATGRSRAFINDTPVNLTVIGEIVSRLLDIHSQHGNEALTHPEVRLEILDTYAGSRSLLERYRVSFKDYVSLRSKIKRLKEKIEKNKAEREYITFRLEQIEKIKPKEGELEEVERQFEILSDSDRLQADLGEACSLLEGNDASILSSVNRVESLLSDINLSALDKNNEEDILRRIESLRIEIKDIAEVLSVYLDNIEADPAKLARVTQRMNQLYEALKRFKVKDEAELISQYKELKEKLKSIETGDEEVGEMEKQARKLAAELKTEADALSEARREAAKKFASELIEKAVPLGLPNLRFEVELSKGKLTIDGQDTIEFLCSFNKNHPLQALQKVASGGELARVTLSLKSIMASRMNLPTIIFDEVDTGVSGEIADKMGNMMREIGETIQVLTITHLPQVAAKGKQHFKVFKKDHEEKTRSYVVLLNEEERVNEIAGMLSGSVVNESALLNAKDLLEDSKQS